MATITTTAGEIARSGWNGARTALLMTKAGEERRYVLKTLEGEVLVTDFETTDQYRVDPDYEVTAVVADDFVSH